MLNTLKKIFVRKADLKFKKLMAQGALIIDVRTKAEFESGHILGAINIASNQIKENLYLIPDKRAILITCCATGGRSEAAKQSLNAYGYLNVYNGGGWKSLIHKLS